MPQRLTESSVRGASCREQRDISGADKYPDYAYKYGIGDYLYNLALGENTTYSPQTQRRSGGDEQA